MIAQENASQLAQFRQQVYQNFNKRADTLMNLVDALSSNTRARSVVELSLEACFQRDYSSLFKAIADFDPGQEEKNLAQLAAPYLPQPQRRPFWLLGVDVTPQSRPYADTLEDRSYIYQPTPIKSNKPITIGHPYSSVFCLPERAGQPAKTFVIPLSTRRVKSSEDKELVGAEQICLLLEDEALPFHDQLCAEVDDSSYSKPRYLHANRSKTKLVTIVRVRSNRTFYQPPCATRPSGSKKGHPTWFGTAFCLRHPQTWPAPDATAQTPFTSRRGRVYQVEIEGWYDLLMRGERKPTPIPMHQHPFTLICIRLFNEKGELAYQNPLWLIVVGEKRRQLSLTQIFAAYNQRYDLEHFFRFGKQRLLLDRFQTPDTQHEERWWLLAHLAYLQLWVAREEAGSLPRPWERSLPEMRDPLPSPALVQRDFGRIIRQFGTPAQLPKRRGNSHGRPKGTVFARRERSAVIYKGQT
jgi:hypothetical protein